MFRRSLTILSVLLCGATLATPVGAKSKPVTRHSTPHTHPLAGNQGYFSIRKGLKPGHAYRLEILSSSRRVHIAVQGFEDYTWVANHHFGEATHSLHFTVTTPGTYTLKQPIRQKLTGWMLVMSFTDTVNRPIGVTVKDLGKRK